MTRKQDLHPSDWYERELAGARNTAEYDLEWLLLDVEEAIHKAMEERGVSRSDLAARLGTSRAFVTKLLGGHENLTLKTLVRVAGALGAKVEMKFIPREDAGSRADGRRKLARAK